MVMQNSIRAEAENPAKGMSIEEFLEFSHAVERALKLGDVTTEDMVLGSSGFSAQIRKLRVIRKTDDKGKWNVA